MKKSFYIYISALIAAAALCVGCHKKSEKDVLKEHLQQCASSYVHEELQVANPDSVVVMRFDTVTERGYAALVLEMLENLGQQYKMMYDEATFNDDPRVENLEIYLNQIDRQTDYFRNVLDADAADSEQLLLYLISAAYYKNGECEEFICFSYPDFTLHILDPFGDNLLNQ